MRPYIVAGNWKMHMDSESGAALASDIRAGIEAHPLPDGARAVLFPP